MPDESVANPLPKPSHPDVSGSNRDTSRCRSSLRVAVIRDLDDLKATLPSWQRLLDRSVGVSAFATPTAILTWYDYVEPRDAIYTVAVWHHNELVGLMPLSMTSVGPIRLLTNTGAEFGYSSEPLLGEEPYEVAAALIDFIAKRASDRFTSVILRKLKSDGAMATVLAERSDLACEWSDAGSRSLIRFDEIGDPAEYFRHVARKHSVPRRTRRLAEQFGKVEYVPQDAEPDQAIDSLVDMLHRRFGSREQQPAEFATQHRADFTRLLVNHLIRTGNAYVSSLLGDERRLAVSINLRAGTQLFGYFVANDPDYGKYGLGNIELYHYLTHAHASGATEVDLGSAAFSYKRRWANATANLCNVTISALGWRRQVSRRFRRLPMRRRALDWRSFSYSASNGTARR